MENHKITVSERVARQIEENIMAAVYPQDSFLPSVRALVEQHEVGNKTILAALNHLVKKGLLEKMPGRGCRVLSSTETVTKPVAVLYQAYSYPVSSQNTLGLVLASAQARLRELGLVHEVINTRQYMPSIDELHTKCSAVLCAMAITEAGEAFYNEISERGITCVVANLEPDWKVSATYVDHAQTTMQALNVLHDMGHSDIALLIRDPDLYFYGNVRRGYIEGLEHLGLRASEDHILVSPDYGELPAFQTMRTFLKAGHRPTAFIAGRDYLARGIWEACTDVGMVVGRDVSIIGYDNLGWPGGKDTLTTFEEPCEDLGRVAADMLHERLLRSDAPIEKREVTPRLVLRKSVCPYLSAAVR